MQNHLYVVHLQLPDAVISTPKIYQCVHQVVVLVRIQCGEVDGAGPGIPGERDEMHFWDRSKSFISTPLVSAAGH
jgi:hypothetical protein